MTRPRRSSAIAVGSSSPSRPDNKGLAIAFRLLAAIGYAVMAAMAKLGHEAGIGVVEIVFYRYAFGLIPLLLWAFWSRNHSIWKTKMPGSHLLRAMLGLASIVLAFSALRYLPVAEAVAISFTAPMFAVAVSALLLREQVGARLWCALFVGFGGMLLVTQPWSGKWPLVGVGLGLIAALGVACINILVRTIGRTERPETAVLWFTVIAMAAIGLAMPLSAEAHDRNAWLILAAAGLSGGLSQLLMTSSLRFAAVSDVAPFDYFQLPWAALLGWLLWQDYPTASTWLGGAVIIGSGIYLIYHQVGFGTSARKRAEAAAAMTVS